MKKRGESIERTFAQSPVTGGMRRTHVRGHKTILKRLMIHTAGLNLALVMRKMFGIGKPRTLQGRSAARLGALCALWGALVAILRRYLPRHVDFESPFQIFTDAGSQSHMF